MEKINDWSQIAIWIFTFGLALAAVLQWWSGTKLDEIRRAENAKEQGRIAAAQRQAEDANRKAEEERLARVKIEKRLAPRTLTPEQRGSLLAALQLGPKGQVKIVSVLGDGESLTFASELSAMLQQAGWPTSTGGQITYNPEGLLIAVGDPNSPPQHAVAFQRALATIGLAAPWTKESGLSPDSFILIVGHKPQQ